MYQIAKTAAESAQASISVAKRGGSDGIARRLSMAAYGGIAKVGEQHICVPHGDNSACCLPAFSACLLRLWPYAPHSHRFHATWHMLAWRAGDAAHTVLYRALQTRA